MLSTIALIAMTVTAPPVVAEPGPGDADAGLIELAYSFPDSPVLYEMVQTMNTKQTAHGQQTEVNQTTTSRQTSRRVSTRETGEILLANTTESIRVKMTGPGLDIDYDSENPDHAALANDPTVASFAMLDGLEVRLLMRPNGEILEVENIDAIQATFEGMADPVMKEIGGMMLTEDAIISMNEANYQLLPDAPIPVGKGWERAFDTVLPFGTVSMEFDLKLLGVTEADGRRLADIEIGGTIGLTMEEGQEVDIELSHSSLAGRIAFSIDEGLIHSMDLSTLMHMDVLSPGTDHVLVGLTTTQETSTRRVED